MQFKMIVVATEEAGRLCVYMHKEPDVAYGMISRIYRSLKDQRGMFFPANVDWRTISCKRPLGKMRYMILLYVAYGAIDRASGKEDCLGGSGPRPEPAQPLKKRGTGWLFNGSAPLCILVYDGHAFGIDPVRQLVFDGKSKVARPLTDLEALGIHCSNTFYEWLTVTPLGDKH
eukprot:g1827.t1